MTERTLKYHEERLDKWSVELKRREDQVDEAKQEVDEAKQEVDRLKAKLESWEDQPGETPENP